MPETAQGQYWIRIFVPDGDPEGLRLVDKMNRPALGVVFNRTNYKKAVKRKEFEQTGVYILVGSSGESSLPTIYIGEGDPIKDRLNQHYSKKDFWDWAVFFVASDNSLNKAHVKHLESCLLGLAKGAKQCKLDNLGSSLPPTLSEPDAATANSFLEDMLGIFPLIGLNVFEKPQTKRRPNNVLSIESKGIKATGYEDAKGFVVRSDSQAVKDEAPTIHNYLSTLRKDLLEQGVLVDRGGFYLFTQDHVFGSPSTSAGVVLARSANGRTEWKRSDGRTLKEIQEDTADREANTGE